MALTIGIVGLPNVGKSTLFNALTKAGVLAANYPFATIEPNIGVVPLPDPRLGRLAEIFSSARELPATVSFVDIAGIVRGASQGEGLGNTFLAHIREADAICQVVRVFRDDDVAHVDGAFSPRSDVETVETELCLADLQTLERTVPRLEKQARTVKDLRPALANALAAQRCLEAGQTLYAGHAAYGVELAAARELQLLTTKPFVYVFNVDEDQLTDAALHASLRELVAPADCVFLDARLEADLAELDADDAAELLGSVGVTQSGLQQLARVGFHTLGLQTFLTAGPKEARAWTIRAGWTAPQAAGVIHSDFQRGFVKAEVVSFDAIDAAGSMAAARAAGRVRIEGKDYVMRDGDVVEFRFNV
ncbi:MAG: redox-regulated ATPase YchF [Dermatophilaceae bacterium]